MRGRSGAAVCAVLCLIGLLPATGASAAGKPDLVMAQVSDPPLKVTAGKGFQLKQTVKNKGTKAAAPSTSRVYLSSNKKREVTLDTWIATTNVPQLGAGKTAKSAVTAFVPSRLFGFFHVIVCADEWRYVRESNEKNNCWVSESKIEVKRRERIVIDEGRLEESMKEAASNAARLPSEEETWESIKIYAPYNCPDDSPDTSFVDATEAIDATRAFLVSQVGEDAVKAVEDDPRTESADKAVALGVMALSTGFPGAALASQLEAIRQSPADSGLYSNAASLLIDLGRPDIALGMLDAGLLLDDDSSAPMGLDEHAIALNNRSRAFLTMRRWSEGESAAREALALDPFLSEARGNLAHALQCQGRFGEANEEARAAATRTPADDPTVNAVEPIEQQDSGEPRPDVIRLPSDKVWDLSAGEEATWPALSIPGGAKGMAEAFTFFEQAMNDQFARFGANLDLTSAAISEYYSMERNPEPLEDWKFNRLYDAIGDWRWEPELQPLWKQAEAAKKKLDEFDDSAGMPEPEQGETLPKYCGRLWKWADSKQSEWAGLFAPVQTALKKTYEAAYPVTTGLAANAADPNAHTILTVRAKSELEGLIGDALIPAWGRSLGWGALLGGQGPTGESCWEYGEGGGGGGAEETEQSDPASCPSALKAAKLKVDLEVVELELTCEKVKVEIGESIGGLFGPFASLEQNFATGQTTIFMGAKGGNLGIEGKSGLYIRLGEGQEVKNGAVDVGWRVEVEGSVGAGGLNYNLAEDDMDFSFVKTAEDLIGNDDDQPDTGRFAVLRAPCQTIVASSADSLEPALARRVLARCDRRVN